MRRLLDGFGMAWGMFLAIPCPLRRWNEEAREQMLLWLPFMGLIVGGVWVGLLFLPQNVPLPLRALLMTAAPWLTTGFLHLDGYMDVCDAVLSRRELAVRQKILKDSHCGAFAVIGMVLLALTQWGLFLPADGGSAVGLLCIPAVSRACAAIAVRTLRPMGTSQYAALKDKNAAVTVALWLLLALGIGLPLGFCGSFAPLATAAGYWLAAWYADRQLGGMSGDVSGFALTLGELAGIAVWTLAR